jgi:hypothetical protein
MLRRSNGLAGFQSPWLNQVAFSEMEGAKMFA